MRDWAFSGFILKVSVDVDVSKRVSESADIKIRGNTQSN